MKKLLITTMLLSVLLCLALGIAANGAEVITILKSGSCGANGANVKYTLRSDYVLTISGSGDMKNYAKFTESPWDVYYNQITAIVIEDGVTSIGTCAFNATKCKSLTIGNSVKSIGKNAFSGLIVDTITIPDSVTSIGESAFFACGFDTITLGNGVKSIGNRAFWDCRYLTAITIPDNVTSIGNYAFDNCDRLTNVTIGNGVTSIGDYAFDRCPMLDSITLGNSITSIGEDAFTTCEALKKVYVDSAASWCQISFANNSTNPLSNGAVLYIDKKIARNITIPEGVTSIGKYAFKNYTTLTGITIPDSVTSIAYEAFSGCTGLTNVTIGNGVTSIGGYAFYGCTGLTNVTIGNGVTSIGGYAFKDCKSIIKVYINSIEAWCNISFNTYYGYATPLQYGAALYLNGKLVKNLTIPEGVTSISDYAFRGCESLTDVTIGNDVTSIGDYAFYYCKSLTNVTIGNSVTSIGDYVFDGCKVLTSVTIGNNVTSIGYSAFCDCTSLTDVTIGNNVASIDEYAFSGCTSLAGITIPDSVTRIATGAFDGCTGLTDVTIGKGVTEIVAGTFEDCTSLTSLTLRMEDCYIEGDAFYGTALTDIYYMGSEQDWQDYIFVASPNDEFNSATVHYNIRDDISLNNKCGDNLYWEIYGTELTISGTGAMYDYESPYSGGTIAPWFEKQDELTWVTIEEGVTSIGDYAFALAPIGGVTLPNSLEEIGEMSFAFSSIERVELPASLDSFYYTSFACCPYLEHVGVNSQSTWLTSIDGVLANKNDNTLYVYPSGRVDAEYTIPSHITAISAYAFSSPTDLEKVYIHDNVTTIADNAFYVCEYLTIYASAGSAAHTYAINNDIPFVAIDGDSVKITAFNVSPVSGLGLANISTENVPDSATVFIAAYNDKKALCEIQKVSLKDDGTGQAIITAQGVKNYKVFVWNPSTMKQLCNAAIYEVK